LCRQDGRRHWCSSPGALPSESAVRRWSFSCEIPFQQKEGRGHPSTFRHAVNASTSVVKDRLSVRLPEDFRQRFCLSCHRRRCRRSISGPLR
jgi:hypothetical protein